MTAPRAVALGGGHGLAASLSALRRVTSDLTAIVTVADDGGSSGRLRRDYGVLPPGDLRMALAALCGDDEWGTTWSKVVQHRFGGDRELAGHAVGNLLIVALWDLLGDTVAGLEWVGRLLGTGGRVLPMAAVPLDIVAEVVGADPDRPEEVSTVRGQAECASTPGQVRSITLLPPTRPRCPRRCARCSTRSGWCSARARGSPACCRTCWCPSSPRRCTSPRPGGWSSSTWRRSRGRRRDFRHTSTSRSSPGTRLRLLWM